MICACQLPRIIGSALSQHRSQYSLLTLGQHIPLHCALGTSSISCASSSSPILDTHSNTNQTHKLREAQICDSCTPLAASP